MGTRAGLIGKRAKSSGQRRQWAIGRLRIVTAAVDDERPGSGALGLPAGQIPDLPWLYEELEFVEGCSEDLERAHP